MQQFSEIIDALGGPVPFGAAIGVPDSHARTMKARNSIPAEYWALVVAEALRLGLVEINYEALSLMHARDKGRLPDKVERDADVAASEASL